LNDAGRPDGLLFVRRGTADDMRRTAVASPSVWTTIAPPPSTARSRLRGASRSPPTSRNWCANAGNSYTRFASILPAPSRTAASIRTGAPATSMTTTSRAVAMRLGAPRVMGSSSPIPRNTRPASNSAPPRDSRMRVAASTSPVHSMRNVPIPPASRSTSACTCVVCAGTSKVERSVPPRGSFGMAKTDSHRTAALAALWRTKVVVNVRSRYFAVATGTTYTAPAAVRATSRTKRRDRNLLRGVTTERKTLP